MRHQHILWVAGRQNTEMNKRRWASQTHLLEMQFQILADCFCVFFLEFLNWSQIRHWWSRNKQSVYSRSDCHVSCIELTTSQTRQKDIIRVLTIKWYRRVWFEVGREVCWSQGVINKVLENFFPWKLCHLRKRWLVATRVRELLSIRGTVRLSNTYEILFGNKLLWRVL